MGIIKRRKKSLGSQVENISLDSSNMDTINQQDVEISYDNIVSDSMDLHDDDIDEKMQDVVKDLKRAKLEKMHKVQQKSSNVESKDNIKDSCEQIVDAEKQIQEAKLEYKAVTDYLADIQKVDMITGESRETIEEAARNIITLTRERSKYQANDVKLSDVQFRNIKRYEANMLREIKQMRENEDYQRKVKGDLRQLAAEKAKLEYEKEEIIHGQETLKKLAMLAGCLIVLMDIIFLLVTSSSKINMQVPFILSILLGAGIAFYIFNEARKNREEIALNGRKRNKLVGITNKVKVKYVNTQNALDYGYAKFMVSNSMELNSVYEKYIRAKQEAEKYRSNTGLLNRYNLLLVNELDKYHLKDSDIWIYQAAALIDNREMVEIRHRLNERRQKLRSRIDFNYEVKENAMGELKLLVERKPAMKGKVEEEMAKYGIELKEN